MVAVMVPRQTIFMVLASQMSMTRVPAFCGMEVVAVIPTALPPQGEFHCQPGP